MKMQRTYSVFVIGAEPRPRQSMTGSFSYGALDAARDCMKTHLPSFEVIPGGQYVQPSKVQPYGGYRFEAIDHERQVGCVIYCYSEQ